MFFSVLWLIEPWNQNQNRFSPLRLSSMSFCFVWVTSSAFSSNMRKQISVASSERRTLSNRSWLSSAASGLKDSLKRGQKFTSWSQNTDVVAWGAFNWFEREEFVLSGIRNKPVTLSSQQIRSVGSLIGGILAWSYTDGRLQRLSSNIKAVWSFRHSIAINYLPLWDISEPTECSARTDVGQELISSFGIWLDCVCMTIIVLLCLPDTSVLICLLFLFSGIIFSTYFMYC